MWASTAGRLGHGSRAAWPSGSKLHSASAAALRLRRDLHASPLAQFRWRPQTPQGSQHPWTLGLPSHQGFEDKSDEIDEDIPWAERWATFKAQMRQEWSDLVKFLRWERHRKLYGQKYQLQEEMKHGDVMKEFDFAEAECYERFQTGSDKRVNTGYSECTLEPSGRGTAIFSGVLDTRPPKDGNIEVAGWAAIKSKTLATPFNHSVRPMPDWEKFTGVIVRFRGDGRTYMLNLNCPDHFDITWGDVWTHPLFTSGGPYWQVTKIPYSKFYHSVYGRCQRVQHPVVAQDYQDKERWELVHRWQTFTAPIRAVGITLQDRIDGPFHLEIDFIGCYYDVTHFEICKYEHYTPNWISYKM